MLVLEQDRPAGHCDGNLDYAESITVIVYHECPMSSVAVSPCTYMPSVRRPRYIIVAGNARIPRVVAIHLLAGPTVPQC